MENDMYKKSKLAYFYKVADIVSQKSPCKARQVGAILVNDGIIVATGYNGPARGVHHCKVCPRTSDPNYQQGKNLDICPAVHAEVNCIASAARIGAPTKGSALFINTVVPCKNCLSTLVNAGIVEVYALDAWYDKLSLRIAQESGIVVRVNKRSVMWK
jgi:dCMP deaminase